MIDWTYLMIASAEVYGMEYPALIKILRSGLTQVNERARALQYSIDREKEREGFRARSMKSLREKIREEKRNLDFL